MIVPDLYECETWLVTLRKDHFILWVFKKNALRTDDENII